MFINQEGRVQAAPRLHPGGVPLARISGGDHPPRVYGSDIPGGEPRAAWQVLDEIGDGASHRDAEIARAKLRTWLADVNPIFAEITATDQLPDEGLRLNPGEVAPRFSLDSLQEAQADRSGDHGLELILVDWTFGSEELSLYSPPLVEVAKGPCLHIHLADAARLGLTDGDTAVIKLDGGDLEVRVSVRENMAPGVIVLPKHRLLEWQKIAGLPKFVSYEDVKKATA
jgi:NADH-quinone oxidoreductase subunit G